MVKGGSWYWPAQDATSWHRRLMYPRMFIIILGFGAQKTFRFPCLPKTKNRLTNKIKLHRADSPNGLLFRLRQIPKSPQDLEQWSMSDKTAQQRPHRDSYFLQNHRFPTKRCDWDILDLEPVRLFIIQLVLIFVFPSSPSFANSKSRKCSHHFTVHLDELSIFFKTTVPRSFGP